MYSIDPKQLTTWRHHLHGIVETAFEEHETAAYIADELQSLGLEVITGIGGTGVVGTLKRGTSSASVALRADMDGLPIREAGDKSYKSRSDNAMHACGHDGHMAMVLGAAAELANDDSLDGTVHFLFQPAEEPGHGAQAMIDDGLFDRFKIDAMYGIHNMPGWEAGHLLTRSGPLMAAEDNFTIRISGRGGHASRPQLVVDPLVVGAEIVLALQTIVSRSIDPALSAVVSCTEFHSDGARNAIPGEVVITGDTRSFLPEVSALIEKRMRDIVAGVCATHGATGEVSYTHEFKPTINDGNCTAKAIVAARKVVGDGRVNANCDQFMGSEDFGVFARHIPACFMFLGTGTEVGKGGTPLHSRDYDFNDDVLEVGVNFYVEVVKAQLEGR